MKANHISNKDVADIYNRCKSIYDDETADEQTRIKYFEKMYLIEVIAGIYEESAVDKETMDDIFIAYGPGHRPGFKEDLKWIGKELDKYLKRNDNN